MIRTILIKSLMFLAVVSISVCATEEQLLFENEQQKALYGNLIKELRCPKCQNQNIADSNAIVAKDMRAKTKELVEQGQDKKQVIDYMVNRYGQFAHYQPPLNVATSLLWLLPLGFILFALVILIKRSQSSRVNTIETLPAEEHNLDQEIERLLTSDQSTEQGDK